MIKNRQSVHTSVFVFGLILIVLGLGVSRFLISIGGMLLALNWLLEGGFREKFNRLRSNIPALWMLGLFALHIFWLYNTSDFEYAFKDIRIKLPLLMLPVVIGSGRAIKLAWVIRLLWLFLAALMLGTLLAIGHYFTAHNPNVDNIREIVFFSSHIRFSLMLVLGLAVAAYFFISRRLPLWGFMICAAWIVLFLVFLQSLTGLLMLFAIGAVLSIYYGSRFCSGWRRWTWIGIPVVLTFAMIAGMLGGFHEYRTPKESADNFPPFEVKSAGGEKYKHVPENKELENGHYIYRYLAPFELQRSWSRVSEFDFMGNDLRGQRMRFTLMRYMSSMGLRKDSLGFAELKPEDIHRIEQGYTSAFQQDNPVVKRLKATYYEINAYLNGASVQGSSIIQRLVYVETGWQVARKNWLLGVGTGDVNKAILTQYEQNDSQLDMDFRRRAHNQYLTFLISFGLLGALYFIVFIVWSVRYAWRRADFLAIVFIWLAALSFLYEDTLETQVGVTFFAFFYTFFFCQKISTSTGQNFRFNEFWRNSINSGLHK